MSTENPRGHWERLEDRRLLSLTPVGAETTVPAPTVMSQFDMAVAGNGSFIVVADPIEQPGSPDVIAVRYDADGQQIGQPITLDDRGFNISVAMDPDGDAVVAYQKREGLYVVRLSKDGAASAPQRVGVAPAGQAIWETAVSMHDGGGYFVAWLQRHPDFFPLAIQVRAFNSAGLPRSAQFALPGGSSTSAHGQIDIAAKPDGSGAVVTHTVGHDNGDSLVFHLVNTRELLASGSVGSGAFRVDSDVATFADGSFVVGYTKLSGGSLGGPQPFSAGFVERFNAAGTPVGGRTMVGASLPGVDEDKHVGKVSVDTLADGGFLAGFTQDLGGALKSYAEHFDPGGVSSGGPVAVDAGGARAHVIGADAGGGAVLAYLQPDNDPGDVHFRRLRTAAAKFAELRGTKLYVFGTGRADRISVQLLGADVVVTRGTEQRTFAASDVQFLSLNGFAGSDVMFSDLPVPSTIHGGDGDDRIFSGGARDFITGGNGHDRIYAGPGHDVVSGGDGSDYLRGEGGNDRLDGGAWADDLRGDAGNDHLLGGGLNDALNGGLGNDTLEGGTGNDTLFSNDGNIDQLFGDGGTDRADADDEDVLTSIEV